MQIRSGYSNPLTMTMGQGKNMGTGRTARVRNGKTERIQDLQTKRQQLQNEMLLLKSSGSDTGGASMEKLKKMEEKLADMSEELRAARMDPTRPERETERLPEKYRKPDVDSWVKEKITASAGIYLPREAGERMKESGRTRK